MVKCPFKEGGICRDLDACRLTEPFDLWKSSITTGRREVCGGKKRRMNRGGGGKS